MNRNELLSAVLKARGEVERISAELDKAKKIKSEAEMQLLELMDLQGLSSFKTEEGINVIRRETLYASPNKERKEEVYTWVDEECGRADLIKPSIHPRSFTSFISQRIKDKQPIPAELVNSYFKPELVIRNIGG